MTVAELIAELQKMPQDDVVEHRSPHGEVGEVHIVHKWGDSKGVILC